VGIIMNIFNSIPDLPPQIGPIIILALALLLIFAGKGVIKAIIFVIAGLAVLSIALVFAAIYLSLSLPVLIILALAAFIVGGVIGILLLPVGIGIALAVVGYSITQPLFNNTLIALVIAVILFIAGIILADKILIIASVFLGGLMLLSAITALGVPVLAAVLLAIILSCLGIVVQSRGGNKD